MRRTDEAFKQEVLRRYGVQAKNRRNLRILALSPLIFCVFVAAILWLPSLLNLWIPTPVADQPEETTVKEEKENPDLEAAPFSLASRLANAPIESLTFMNPDFSQTTLTITDKEDIDRLVQLMEGIKVTPCERFLQKAFGITLTFKHENGEKTDFILGDFAWCTGPSWWNLIDKTDVQIISDYVSSLLLKHLPSLQAPIPESYLHNDYTYIEIAKMDFYSAVTTQKTVRINELNELSELNTHLKAAMKQASLITEKPPNYSDSVYWIEIYRENTLYVKMIVDRELNLLILAISEPQEAQNVYHFTLPEDTRADLCDYLASLFGGETPPETEKPVEPPTVLTFADFLANKPDRISVYAQFGADQRYDAKDGTNNWFASLMEELQACEFQACDPSMNATNVGKPTIVLTKDGCSLYLLLNDPTDSIITYLYDSVGNLVDTAHYKTDNSLSFGRSISWANSSMLSGNLNVNETSALRKILSEEIKAASYRLYALQDALFSCKNADEIQQILDCIEKMSFTEIPAVNLTCMGSVVTFTMEDGRTATLSFDDAGYLHLLVKDAGGKTITSQWYEFFLKQYTTDILGCLSGIRNQYPVNVYPTPGNLYTELYPYARILNLYPEYLATYTQPSDYEIGEIMRRIHELKLTESGKTPDYVFNQPTLEFWFSSYIFRIIVDGENGYIRTFVEEFDQTTLLVAKMYKGSVQEIAALAAYLNELIPDPPYVEEVHIAPLDIFRTFLNQEIASLTLSVNNISYLPYKYTDAKVISAVLEKLKALSLTNKQEATAVGDSPNSSYVHIDFANGNSMMLTFDTSGYVEYLLIDEKSGITYAGKYRLSAAEVSAFATFIDPYLDAAPSDKVPLIKDLLGNTALQNFLAGVDVTVNTTPEEAPREIEQMLADHGSAVGGFFASGQSFTSPDGVNLDYMLYDYYGSDRSPLSDAERLALVKAGVHPEVIGHVEFSRYTLEEIRSILEDNLAYMPAFADNLHEELLKCTVYVPETNCYYQFHTDFLGRTSGENVRLYRTDRADTVIVLFRDYFYGGLQVAAFRIVGGQYRLYGYTPLPNA